MAKHRDQLAVPGGRVGGGVLGSRGLWPAEIVFLEEAGVSEGAEQTAGSTEVPGACLP